MTDKPENQQTRKRTFFELLEAYRKTAVEQSKITGTSMNECGAMLCGGDIMDDLGKEMYEVARQEGSAEMLERVRRAVVTRYYPDSMNGGKLAPIQCIDSNVLPPATKEEVKP